MKFATRLVMVAGAVAIAGILSLALVPRAVHAVVSTLVTVVNNVPVVNPAPGGAIQGVVTEETEGASRQPVTIPCTGASGGVVANVPCVPAYSVPAGKRLVIEYVDGICSSPGNIDDAIVDVSTNGDYVTHHLAIVREGTNGSVDNFAVAQSLRLYADPGTFAELFFFTTDFTARTGCSGSISGYLEPADVN